MDGRFYNHPELWVRVLPVAAEGRLVALIAERPTFSTIRVWGVSTGWDLTERKELEVPCVRGASFQVSCHSARILC